MPKLTKEKLREAMSEWQNKGLAHKRWQDGKGRLCPTLHLVTVMGDSYTLANGDLMRVGSYESPDRKWIPSREAAEAISHITGITQNHLLQLIRFANNFSEHDIVKNCIDYATEHIMPYLPDEGQIYLEV